MPPTSLLTWAFWGNRGNIVKINCSSGLELFKAEVGSPWICFLHLKIRSVSVTQTHRKRLFDLPCPVPHGSKARQGSEPCCNTELFSLDYCSHSLPPQPCLHLSCWHLCLRPVWKSDLLEHALELDLDLNPDLPRLVWIGQVRDGEYTLKWRKRPAHQGGMWRSRVK